MKTESVREQDVERDWYVVDLDNKASLFPPSNPRKREKESAELGVVTESPYF